MIKKLLIFLFPLFLFGEIIRLDFGGGISVRPIDIGVGVIAIIWIVKKIIKKERVAQKYIYAPMLLFAGLGAFSLLINSSNLSVTQFFISLMYLFRWMAYASIFLVISDLEQKFKDLISKILFFVGFAVVVIGYVQYFLYSDLHNISYLGWDEHMVRMFSVFLDPNYAGAFFVLFFLFLMNSFLNKKNISIGLLSILTLGAVFLTFSRSALVMLLVSSSILFILMNKKRWIGLLISIILIVFAISSRYFSTENINLFRVVSSEARIETAKKALEIIQTKPIFGVGFDAYRYAKYDYNLKNDNFGTIISHADAGVDNSFLFVLATTGIIGFVVYLFLWFRLLKISSIIAIASIMGVFVDSMFINSLFYPFIMLWIWIILALSIKNHN